MKHPIHSSAPWDAEGVCVLYAAPDEADAISMIEIRANVTESGWDSVAFVEAIWPKARANAQLIVAAPGMLVALEMAEGQLSEYCLGDDGRDESARLALTAIRAAIASATGRAP